MSMPNIKFTEKKTQIGSDIHGVVNIAINLNKLCIDTFEQSNFAALEKSNEISHGYKKILTDLDNKIIAAIALHNPEAKDLRELIAYLKMGYEMEKVISGLVKFTNKFTQIINKESPDKETLDLVVKICEVNAKILEFINNGMRSEEDEFDFEENLKDSLILEAESDMLTDRLVDNITKSCAMDGGRALAKNLTLIKKLERVADHGVSIINLIRYAKLGGNIGEKI